MSYIYTGAIKNVALHKSSYARILFNAKYMKTYANININCLLSRYRGEKKIEFVYDRIVNLNKKIIRGPD